MRTGPKPARLVDGTLTSILLPAGVDPPASPQVLLQQSEACSCVLAMQDTYLACHDAYQLLPISSCLAPDSPLQWYLLPTHTT